ncbi:amidohydrolase family protein [Rhizobium paknamense]|uniref:Cytosine deaminase n=1 Tax=Rhizobium paknamense TaxID=1206817 RepID=A0ABU0IIF2_9HYPH|nr:amidohydrolase family protein [Rhizobium paknamense]MDQ0458009.1 cytosine deaminase [Rhizobium paknamense]
MSTVHDLLLTNIRLPRHDASMSLAITAGRIAAVGSDVTAREVIDLGGKLVLPGFADSHIHLDKACLLCRCQAVTGGLKGAIAAVSRLKSDFTVEDVYARGEAVLRRAISQGTMFLRAHVEVDPRAGLRSFEAMKALKQDFAWAIDMQICAFPQEGLTNDPGTEALLEQALADGADLLGGCPYTDGDPEAQMDRLFAMAKAHDVDLDFHLDFDLDASWSHLEPLCRRTVAMGWQGRVAAGHVTKLAAMDEAGFERHAALLSASGVAVTALPSTDLYLNARTEGVRGARGVAPIHLLAEKGVTVSIATNNVLNPFTPFGDCSLLRMANLYANVAQLGPETFSTCLDFITHHPARLMGLEAYGIAVGAQADLIVLDAEDDIHALGGLAQPLMGFKRGRKSFERPAAKLLPPAAFVF